MPLTRDSSDILSQTLEQAIDSVVVIDSTNHVLLFNEAAERLWGYSKDEVIGRNVSILVPGAFRAAHDGYIDANRAGGPNRIVGTSRDVQIQRKDGQTRWGSMSISRIVSGEQVLYTAFVKDVTRQHEEAERVRLLSMVANQTDNAIMIVDAQWCIVYVNAGFENMLGYAAHEVLGRHPTAFLAPHVGSEAVEKSRLRMLEGRPFRLDQLIYRKDGSRVWCSVTANPIHDAQGRLENAVGIFADITSAKIHQVLQHSMLDAMVHETPLQELMALACREIERNAPEVLASVLQVNDDRQLHVLAAPSLPLAYSQMVEGVVVGEGVGTCGTAAHRGETVIVSDIATDPLWMGVAEHALVHGLRSCWSTPIKDGNGVVVGTLALYYRTPRDPTPLHRQLVDVVVPLCALALERDKARAHISQLAFYDSLTDLPNRSLLHARADHALAEARRSRNSLAVLFIDLDRFKQINDSMGHPAGDELLKLFAERLRDNLRQTDIVGRLSGDEFVVVLPQCGSEHVTEVVEQLKLELTRPCRIAGTSLAPSASIGISVFPRDGHDMDTLIHRADMAMYQAKAAGRGRFSFFSHELNQLAQERQALECALREALERDELQLHYQPQVNMHDGVLYGVEALARWTHPQLGAISPARFIPLAEECGLIGDLGLWAIREACRQLAAWRELGITIPAVSVNLSPTNFHNLDLSGVIMTTLDQYRLAATDLTLELTENVLMDTHPSTMKVLHDIHAQGIRLAMDDFGTGYSSLSYLRRLPIQELKLDRSFVQDLENDATSRALSDAVIHIGESLQLKVVAEGIEDEGQYRILKEQGYHVAQGYLFSRPLSAPDLESWLRAKG